MYVCIQPPPFCIPPPAHQTAVALHCCACHRRFPAFNVEKCVKERYHCEWRVIRHPHNLLDNACNAHASQQCPPTCQRVQVMSVSFLSDKCQQSLPCYVTSRGVRQDLERCGGRFSFGISRASQCAGETTAAQHAGFQSPAGC